MLLLVLTGCPEEPTTTTPKLVRYHGERTHPTRPRGPHEGPCPAEMAQVNASCVDKWEGSLVELTADGERPFSPFQVPDGTVSVRAVSLPGVVPQGYISRDAADLACQASEKRLCAEDEWITACQGDPPRAFPYGDTR